MVDRSPSPATPQASSNSTFENIGWTVGNHCNARCGHCYSWKVRRDSREFLTEADVDRVIGQLQALGVKTVNLGGNEPIYTHGPDISRTMLPHIIRRLHDAGIPVGLTTNGVSFTWLDEHHHDELLLINDIDFSLDSPFEGEHDRNRGNRLYRLTIGAMQRCVDLGIDCSIILCGMRLNFTPDYLEAYLALSKLLGSELRVNTLKPVEPGLLDQMPTPEQFYEGFTFLMQRTDCVTLGESCLTAFTGTGSTGCPCGISSFRINAKTPDGRIPLNPCVYMHDFKVGDLLTQDIEEIVQSEQFRSFASRRQRLPQACVDSDCDYLETCRGGCSARAWLVHQDLDARDPYCPQEHARRHGRPDLPDRPQIGVGHGIRVHDNYLCTWIGQAEDGWHSPRWTALEQFLGNAGLVGETRHMSGCRQSTRGHSLVSEES